MEATQSPIAEHIWSKAQVAAERDYRFAERIAILIGAETPTFEIAEMAGAGARAWEREMDFHKATDDEKSGQMTML